MDLATQRLMMAAAGAAGGKTYVDDVFSTFLYTGSSSTGNAINNGIDLAGEGGLVWLKSRGDTMEHYLFDTERGATKYLDSASTNAEGTASDTLTSFNNNGFTLSDNGAVNSASRNFASWNFRKAPGFFDIVTYTGSGSTQTLSHSLESIPGMILVKRLDTSTDWGVYHRGQIGYDGGTDPEDYRLRLNTTTYSNNDTYWGDTAPTTTQFTVGDAHTEVNASGGNYVAYIFAGGTNSPNNARSVDFDGTGDYLSISDHSDLDFGTGDFTVECWFNKRGNFTSYESILGKYTASGDKGYWMAVHSNGKCTGGDNGNNFVTSQTTIETGRWYHIALVRNGTTVSLYLNGTLEGTHSTAPRDVDNSSDLWIGNLQNYSTRDFEGHISNVRLVKGTAVYTSSFTPPTEPLTNITNTKLLCCNSSSTTGSTVTPNTIAANGNPTASAYSPNFNDPAGFVFGKNEDQNVIKCGNYTGNGNSNGPTINVGWEPQWVMVKRTSGGTGLWLMADNMRGVVNGGNDPYLQANGNNAEYVSYDWIEFSPTGFKMTNTGVSLNANGDNYVYTAIRRPDGYVGKPPELGTDVFGLGTRSGSSSNALSNVNVFTDFSIIKRYNNGGEYWATNARLTGKYSLQTNSTDGQLTGALPTSGGVWDYMAGHLVAASNGATNTGSDIIDFGWKRHAGFDVVTYSGLGGNRTHNHSLGIIPEMIWVKCRASTGKDWWVYANGLNGGTNPENYYIKLNTNDAEADQVEAWNDTAPTATSFTVGSNGAVNSYGDDYLALLFSSVSGISKVGSYTGNGSTGSSGPFITTGFSPRFIIVKRVDSNAGYAWNLHDTTRGIDNRLRIQTGAEQATLAAFDLSSTGFRVKTDNASYNTSPGKYVYYAHA